MNGFKKQTDVWITLLNDQNLENHIWKEHDSDDSAWISCHESLEHVYILI